MSQTTNPQIVEPAPKACPKCGRDAAETTRLGKFCDAPLSSTNECKAPHSILDRQDWHNEHLHVTCDVCGYKWLRRPIDYAKRKLNESREKMSLFENAIASNAPTPLSPPKIFINGKLTQLGIERMTFHVGRLADEFHLSGQLPKVESEGETIARCSSCKNFATGRTREIKEGDRHTGCHSVGGVFQLYDLKRQQPLGSLERTYICDRCNFVNIIKFLKRVPEPGTQKCQRRVTECADTYTCGGTLLEVGNKNK